MRLILIGAICLLGASHAQAGLGDYKKQKHSQRARVSEESCPEQYKADCKSKCPAGDAACSSRCDATASSFCEERESKRSAAKWGLAAKGASLGVGAAGMLFDDKMGEAVAGGEIPISPYTVIWNRPSVSIEAGGGLIEAGAKLAALASTFRYRWIGFSTSVDYLWDQTDNLIEADLGPTVYLGSAHILAGFQPSLMVSGGNGVETEYGGGLRALSTYMNDRFLVNFNPLLGRINGQWAYDLKVSLGYRFTPSLYASLGYSYRDILDLNDLDVSSASLQGAFMRLGYRMN